MIEDKELGLKVAADPEEVFWTDIKSKSLLSIASLKHEIIISEAIIKLAEEKLEKYVEE